MQIIQRSWLALMATGFAGFLVGVDYSIVNATLPRIQASLGLNVGLLQWLITGFGITFSSSLVALGRLSDIVGRRKMLYVGLLGFALSSLLAGLSDSAYHLIIARFCQGVFAAAIFPSGMAIVANAFDGASRARALGAYGSVVGVGLALGPMIGGFISAFFGWRWIFLINVPVVCLSFILCLISVRESKNTDVTRVDYFGMVTSILFLSALIFTINEGPVLGWVSLPVLLSSVLSVAFLIIFIVVELRTSEPLVDFGRLLDHAFIKSLLLYVVSCSFSWSVLFLMPMYLQIGLGYNVSLSGLVMLLITGMTAIIPIAASYWYNSISQRQVYHAGFISMLAAMGLFCCLNVSGPLILVVVSFLACGFSWGVGNGICMLIALSKSRSESDAGVITASLLTIMNAVAIILLPIVTGIFRHAEYLQFNHLLNRTALQLSHQQIHQIKALSSDPNKLLGFLHSMDTSSSSEVSRFVKIAFVSGMHWSYLFLFALGLILWSVSTVFYKQRV